MGPKIVVSIREMLLTFKFMAKIQLFTLLVFCCCNNSSISMHQLPGRQHKEYLFLGTNRTCVEEGILVVRLAI